MKKRQTANNQNGKQIINQAATPAPTGSHRSRRNRAFLQKQSPMVQHRSEISNRLRPLFLRLLSTHVDFMGLHMSIT
jgi:hypothetical protein